MPEIKAFRCDGCNKIIESSKDVYKLQLAGTEWIEGPPLDHCQKIKDLGFCEGCARQIKRYLADIAAKEP